MAITLFQRGISRADEQYPEAEEILLFHVVLNALNSRSQYSAKDSFRGFNIFLQT